MKVNLNELHSGSNWINGTIDKYNFEAKHFDEGSPFGIDNGRVSKLMIWDEKKRNEEQNIFSAAIVNYDRGWDIEPETDEHKQVYNELLEYLEQLPKRF
jgi:hypothetical protein